MCNQIMRMAEFIREHAFACGGDWAAMVMTAIRNGAPELYSRLEDRTYEFGELIKLLDEYLGNQEV